MCLFFIASLVKLTNFTVCLSLLGILVGFQVLLSWYILMYEDHYMLLLKVLLFCNLCG